MARESQKTSFESKECQLADSGFGKSGQALARQINTTTSAQHRHCKINRAIHEYCVATGTCKCVSSGQGVPISIMAGIYKYWVVSVEQ